MKQFCFTCIFLCACCFSKAQVMENPDSLFMAGDYATAAVGYEYAAFRSSDPLQKAHYLLEKAYCYKAALAYSQAIEILERIRVSPGDSLRKLVDYEKALLYHLTEDYQKSYNELLKYQVVNGRLDQDLTLLLALNLIALNRWEESHDLLFRESAILGLDSAAVQFVFSEKLKLKNPDKAYNLSMFLPGVGQMYAGYFFKGLLSGTIQAALVGFSAYSIYQGYFFTGGMTGVALFYTFYFGGARHARELAIARNEEQGQRLSQRLMEVK